MSVLLCDLRRLISSQSWAAGQRSKEHRGGGFYELVLGFPALNLA